MFSLVSCGFSYFNTFISYCAIVLVWAIFLRKIFKAIYTFLLGMCFLEIFFWHFLISRDFLSGFRFYSKFFLYVAVVFYSLSQMCLLIITVCDIICFNAKEENLVKAANYLLPEEFHQKSGYEEINPMNLPWYFSTLCVEFISTNLSKSYLLLRRTHYSKI